jgi:outer membrane protein assembly factor BamA
MPARCHSNGLNLWAAALFVVALACLAPGAAPAAAPPTPGPVLVKEVCFTGNTFVSAARLRREINPADDALMMLVPRLVAFYRAFGFHDVKVHHERRYSADGREVTLVFHIQEGVRYNMDSLSGTIGIRSKAAEALELYGTRKAGDYTTQVRIYRGQELTYPKVPGREIQINVQEAPTGSLLFGVGVNSCSGLNGSIILNERNFDLSPAPKPLP